jgi:RNA polymerase sigma-70 factor (ECF subfamily)
MTPVSRIVTSEMLVTRRPDEGNTIESDERLVEATRSGDMSAFKTLVRRYESRVAGTVYGILGNCPEADDVGQESFIGFYKGLSSFRGESSVSTYLTRIAINLSLNELKRRKRRLKTFVQPADDNPVEAEDKRYSADAYENRQLVERALDSLAPEFRSVVVMRVLEGYSTAETAEILKIPLGTAQSRLARALAKMREFLSPQAGGDK